MMNFKAFAVLFVYIVAVAFGVSWLFGTLAEFVKAHM